LVLFTGQFNLCAAITGEFPIFFGYIVQQFVAVANKLHLRFAAFDNFPVQYLDAVYDRMVFAIICDIFTARCADFGAFDNGLGIIAAGCGDFCGISGLLLDILRGIIRVDLAFGNAAQAAVKVLTGFIIDAALALEEFRIGGAITVYNFNGSSRNACADNFFPVRGFFVVICSIFAVIRSIIYNAACCVLRAACCVLRAACCVLRAACLQA